MLKAIAKDNNGDTIVLIGLSRKNLQILTNEMGDTFLRVSGEEMGLDLDIIVFSGETEAKLALMIRQDGTEFHQHWDEILRKD